MKTEKQFLAECDEREELIALVLSEAYPQIMINHIEEYISDLPSIQFEMDENAIRVWEVTAQGETINEETGEEGNWENLDGYTHDFEFKNYIGVEGELTKITWEFEKLTSKYAEQKSALVDTNHHDRIYYDLQGYEETFFEALVEKDVKWLEELVRDLKKQTKAFDNVIKGLNEVSYTFC